MGGIAAGGITDVRRGMSITKKWFLESRQPGHRGPGSVQLKAAKS